MYDFFRVVEKLVTLLLISVCIGLNLMACDLNTNQQTEADLNRLEQMRDHLFANPDDKEALRQICSYLSDDNRITRSNAAAVLGLLAQKNAVKIKDEAVPSLDKLLMLRRQSLLL